MDLVGRTREVGVLAGALERMPRLVLCRGEAGVGKTRLAEEFERYARARRVPVVWGRATETAGAPPYRPWRQVVDTLATGALDPFARLSSGRPSDDGEDMEGMAERFRLFDAVSRLLRTAAADRGLAVILDDLHWADRPSMLLLRHLASDLSRSRLVILASYRGGEHAGDGPIGSIVADLVRESVTERLNLAGLTAAAVGAHLAGITRVSPPSDVVRRVHEVTGGNPFFVGELARMLPEDGGWRLPAVVPLSVRAAIALRTARLSPVCRSHLRVAAIVGQDFPATGVAAAARSQDRVCLEALEEAVAAGLIEPADAVGRYRFTHALIRDAVEADLTGGEAAALHKAAAEVIEELHTGRLGPHLAQLAHHWAAAAVLGDRLRAVGWIERAADDALHRLAFEEAARQYRVALETGGNDLDDLDGYRLLSGLADALYRSGEVGPALEMCVAAAAVGRRLGRPDLIGEAALTVECVADSRHDATLRRLCEEALDGLGTQPSALRIRLLARLAETGMYLDEYDHANVASGQALQEALDQGPPDVLVAALRARRLVRSGPDGVEERVKLTERMVEAGRLLRSPSTEMWGRLWRFESCFERGNLAEAGAEIERLAQAVDHVGGPLARWHLMSCHAVLAQARGLFADAHRHLDEAYTVIAPTRLPAAIPARMALLTLLDHHQGRQDWAEAERQRPNLARLDSMGIMDRLGPVYGLVGVGLLDQAAMAYRALGPVESWRPPPFFRLVCHTFAVSVAIALGERDDVATLRELLLPHRQLHVVSGLTVVSYNGPVELALGRAAAFLGDLDAAVTDLDEAAESCRISGAEGFLVEARCELSTVLVRRGQPDDLLRARGLIKGWARTARALGMAPYIERAAALSAELDAATALPLTSREVEVARHVAAGMTNREIAATLFVSERTAQNHVQHILTKLGFSRRSQIATWVTAHLSSPGK